MLVRMPTEPPAHSPATILVVDDEETNRIVLRSLCRKLGHRPLLAEDGAQALAVLAEFPVDLVLLDLGMPGIDGFEVLERMHRDEALRAVPVVVVSAQDETEDVAHCIAAGAMDHLSKPYEPALLEARIASCLERKRWFDREQRYIADLETERQRSDALLRAILPEPVVERMKAGSGLIADQVPALSTLFADVVGFTAYSRSISAGKVVAELNALIARFDALTEARGMERLKVAGDSYMAVAGVFDSCADHAERAADLALDMMGAVAREPRSDGRCFELRIGLATGSGVAGVIGARKFTYDVWGDSVNLAARMESSGTPGKIQVSEAFHALTREQFEFESRGEVELKGFGCCETWFLVGRR